MSLVVEGNSVTQVLNGENMKFINISPDEELKVLVSDDFEIVDGHPDFDRKYVTYNALERANEYIKHTYRQGWSLPDIP